MEIIKNSNLSKEVKDNAKRSYLFNTARVALKKNDSTSAKNKSEEFIKQIETLNNQNQIRLSHQLKGMIALEEKNYDKAIEEFLKANQRNPYNLYRICLAYKGKGDKEKFKLFCTKVIEFNALNSLNYSFIRNKAKDMIAGL